MKIREVVKGADSSICKDALAHFLEKYLNPAFGTLPKREVDLLVLGILETLKFVEQDP